MKVAGHHCAGQHSRVTLVPAPAPAPAVPILPSAIPIQPSAAPNAALQRQQSLCLSAFDTSYGTAEDNLWQCNDLSSRGTLIGNPL